MTVGEYVTLEGLQIPTVPDLVARVTGELRAAVDPNLDCEADSPMGPIIGVFCSHLREAWEAVEIAYNGNNPDAAEGYLLDSTARITGSFRAAATRSSFFGPRRITVTLTAGTTLPAGVLVSVAGNPAITCETTENVTATGAGDYLVAARCTQTGPIVIAEGTLTVIQTPVVGWSAVTNAFDAVVGANRESDADFRIRREAELDRGARGNPAAVTAALLAYTTDDLVKPILEAVTYENTGDVIDSAGRPPHSIEALVFDGIVPSVTNDTIAQIVWDNRGGGIQTFGNASGTAIDEKGENQTVYFSRPAILPMALDMSLVYNRAKPAPDPAQIAIEMVKALTKISTLGLTVLRWNVFDAAAQDNVPGTLGCTSIAIGPNPTPLPPFTNFTIPLRTKTTLETANVSITLTAGTP